jgi:hypothetical protein
MGKLMDSHDAYEALRTAFPCLPESVISFDMRLAVDELPVVTVQQYVTKPEEWDGSTMTEDGPEIEVKRFKLVSLD